MKSVLFAVLLTAVSMTAQAEVRYLHYKYNHNVMITISNVACPIIGIKQQYDYAVIARRIDGASLIGCFKKQSEEMIEIQWYKGDKTVLPANVFLTNPDQPNPKRQEM